MPWVISFIVSWIVFFLLVDRSRLRINIWGGVLALALASIVDWGGQKLGLYAFHDLIIPWFGCSAFYEWGPVFAMGVIYVQSIPKNKWLQTANIFVFSLLFLVLNQTMVYTYVADYIHWHILACLIVNLLAFASLTWFGIVFLNKNTGETT